MVQIRNKRSTTRYPSFLKRLRSIPFLFLIGSASLILLIIKKLAVDDVHHPGRTPSAGNAAVAPIMQLPPLKQEGEAGSKKSYGLTVVHCREKNMGWLDDVPKDWHVTVYETCGQNVSRASLPFKNAGSEECSAYLQTMIGHYDSLPDINIFVQSDVLIGSGRVKPLDVEHSPFHNFGDLVNATESWAGQQQSGGLGLLAYGPSMGKIKNINSTQNYILTYPREIFDIMGLNYTASDTNLRTRSGACFAVHRDRIRANAIEKYRTLQDSIVAKGRDSKSKRQARRQCCGLENTWHAVLGEEYILPAHSTVDHLWGEVKHELAVMKKRNVTNEDTYFDQE